MDAGKILVPPAHCALVVRPLQIVTPEERRRILEDVEYNVFAFPAGLVTCDFLSDSGTSAMTDTQWAALMRGDESYGRNWGYYCLLDAFRDIFERGEKQQKVFQAVVTGSADVEFYRSKLLQAVSGGFVNGGPYQLERPNFFIVPQGRCAEHLLFSAISEMDAKSNKTEHHGKPVIISNGFFDTTGANAAVAGFELQTFTQPGLSDTFSPGLIGKRNPFKGNLDVEATEIFINDNPGKVTMVLMTITNNWAAAQPVSMANIRKASALANDKSIPLFFDACRFAENAHFIQRFEAGYAGKEISEIVQEMFSYVEGFTISLKKDGLANMGGVLCFRDEGMFMKKYEGIGLRLKERQILSYGNDSYGGMSGRDLMAATTGLYQVTNQAYLANRINQVQVFAQDLEAAGIAVLLPPGGHAVYLDMDAFFNGCDRKPDDFASVGFTLELIKDYGIRSAEAGPFGWAWDLKTPEERDKIPNLVRFAVPRHVMSDEHIKYTVAAIKELHNRRHTIPNVTITRGKTMRLRHFSSGLKPVPVQPVKNSTYVSEAQRQLTHLSSAVDQDPATKEQLLDALSLAVGDWGRAEIGKQPGFSGWISGVSNETSPLEYSVAIDQRTGKTELRFLVEAQPSDNSWASLREGALGLTENIASKFGASFSLERFNLIRNIFLPPKRDPGGIMAAWHSCAMSPSGPEWKIYLDPAVSGKAHAQSTTREALSLLGIPGAWNLIEKVMSASDSVIYFSLDLSPDTEARVKVYVSHQNASASDIARKHRKICPDADAYEIQRFCIAISGGSRGPFTAKPPISCFAFTRADVDRPVGTVHFPLDAYAPHDEEARARVEQYYANAVPGVSSLCLERYARVLSVVQRRPLARKPGIHAWVSLKMNRGGKLTNAFYLSPEMFENTENAH